MPYRPLAAEAGRVHVCAHRGHSIAAPENTLPALTAAAAHGATVCEIDVVLTADDEIVLLHDEILDRTTDGTGRAANFSLARVRYEFTDGRKISSVLVRQCKVRR